MMRRLPVGASLLALLRPDLRVLPLVLLLGLLAAALEGLGIGLIIPLLDILLGGGGAAQAGALPASVTGFASGLPPRERILVICGAILALITFKNLVAFANTTLSAWIYGRASHAMRKGLAYRLTWVGQSFFSQESPGRLLNTISNESWRASDAIATFLALLVHACAVLILFLFLCLLSWQLTLAVFVGVVVTQLAQSWIASGLKGLSREVAGQNAGLASRMLHLVDGARLIRAFGEEAGERRRFEAVSDAVRRLLFRLEARRGAIGPAMEVLHAMLFLAVIAGAWLGGVAFPVIAAFLVLLYRMQPHVRSIQTSAAQLQSLSGSLAEVEWLLSPDGKPAPPGGKWPAPSLARSIRFDAVTFGFETGAPPVLSAASFEIRAHHSTALVGRSGAGKTTIVNLICRFVDPQAGTIWVDDVPLRDIAPDRWRRQVAVASQDLDLLEASVLDNIRYGAPGATPTDVERAARMADADRFIRSLPQRYDTAVGRGGANLSAGQKQRIALARALVRDPEILILDEATNAVDGLSETAILKTLKARRGRTTIVISHHRKTLDGCDDVIILKDGAVAASLPLGQLAGAEMEELYDYAHLTGARAGT